MSLYTTELTQPHGLIYYTLLFCLRFFPLCMEERKYRVQYGIPAASKEGILLSPRKSDFSNAIPPCGCLIVCGWIFQWNPYWKLSNNKTCCFNHLKMKKWKYFYTHRPLISEKALFFGRSRAAPIVLLPKSVFTSRWFWSIDVIILTDKTEVLGEKSVPMQLYPQKISHGLWAPRWEVGKWPPEPRHRRFK